MDVTKYTNAYLKEAYEQAKKNVERLPNNKVAKKNYNDLLAEMKRRGFIKNK